MVAGKTESPFLPRWSVASCWPAPSTHPHRRLNKASAASFQDQVRSAKNDALLVAGLLKASRFFGICALTWSTVVLIGGLASTLNHLDFYLISILLLVEAARLSATEFFSKLLTKTLFRESDRPEAFGFRDLQSSWSFRLDLVGLGFTGLLAALSLVSAVVRFSVTGRYGFTVSSGGNSNTLMALYAFYVLVVLNSSSALLSCILRPFLRRSFEDSITRYHDKVYRTALTSGTTDADDIDMFDFAFEKLASDYSRNIRPVTIIACNRNLIKFIYESDNGVGVTCEHLKSSDPWKQVVAAALPGFWTEEKRIEKQVALFWALQDRLYSAGKVAEAAANSIHALSKAWAGIQQQHPFLIIDPNRVKSRNIVDSLMDLILHPLQSSLLFQLRGLQGCCRSPQVLKHIYNTGGRDHGELRLHLQNLVSGTQQRGGGGDGDAQMSRPEELCLKLVGIVAGRNHIRQTTKMFAASTLHAILCFGGELEGDARARFAAMVQDKLDLADLMLVTTEHTRPYIWLDEKIMLDDLRASLGLDPFPYWHAIRVLGTDGKDMELSETNSNGKADGNGELRICMPKSADVWHV